MVYSHKLVAAVMVDGKVVRDISEGAGEASAKLPFGAEYSLRIKNLNSERAIVKIAIDGQDVTDGWVVYGANESYDLEGFIKNRVVTNRFKFIEKTKEISEFRGDKIDDGLIVITYKYELPKPVVKSPEVTINPWYEPYPNPWKKQWHRIILGDSIGSEIKYGSLNYESKTMGGEVKSQSCFTDEFLRGSRGMTSGPSGSSCKSNDNRCFEHNDSGITVKGSEVNQTLNTTYVGACSAEETIVIKLTGFDSKQEKISKPVFVNTKVRCETCGRFSRSDAKFCRNCGSHF